MRILVTGATGTVGRHVIDHLLTAGVDVRATTRDPETANLPQAAEVVHADLEHLESIPFEGVDRLYLLALGDTEQLATRAKQAGVQRIVLLSSLNDDPYHRGAERAVENSGLEWTHVRPGMFAANLLDWAEGIRADGVVKEPYAQARHAPTHEQDIAAVAATALLFDNHNGQIYPLSGPEALTKPQQAAAISEAIGQPIRFEELTPAQWREHVKDRMPEFVVDFLLDIWQHATDHPDQVLSTVQDVLGRPPRTVKEWAADHVGDFR